MAVRKIRLFDDKMLRKRCKEVETIDDHVLELLDDMMDTLHDTENGAALAANQVGILKRLVVVDYGEYCLKLVNPRIVESSGEQECIEACLSFPGKMGKTVRPQTVTVSALNEKGEEVLITGEGIMAKCFCHELEHLDGVVFLDHAVEIELPLEEEK
ncbi:peptide deformylase [Murimonas intestini]|uniref:peptide deformylase n=1 Tax=Murimonas intestini TaxID=1337051 RepID=UPI0011DC7278|nr:peptide deformylase [Murimonas intestini]